MGEWTDWKTPGTCANVPREDYTDWTDVDNAKTSNDQYASCYLPKLGTSDWLRVTDFGFSAEIPAGATIDGIEVKIERKAAIADWISDQALYLRKTSGQVGDDKASATRWTTSDIEATYGGEADTWNAGLVDTEVRNSDFGVDFGVVNWHSTGAFTAYVDLISIRVHYTAAPSELEVSVTDGLEIGDTALRAMAAGLSIIDGLKSGDTTGLPGLLNMLDGLKLGDSPSLLASLLASDGFKIGEGTIAKYEYYDTGDTTGANIGGVYWKAQTFTPSVAHQITSVKILIFRSGSPGTLTVSIRATDGEGKPTGNDLCSGTTNADTLPISSPYEWREITFGSGYALPASTTFAIVVRALQGGPGNYVYWRIDPSDPTYSGGYYAYSSNSGSTWTMVTGAEHEDLMFEEWDILGTPSISITINPFVADGLKIGDSNILNFLLSLLVTDGMKLGDSLSILSRLAVSDGLELGDSPSMEMLANLLRSDGVKLGDAATLGEAILYLAIVEGLKAGDTSLIGMLADILASDGTKLGDATIQSLLASLGIEDGLKLGDTELADLADGILLSIIEGIKIGDSTSPENLIALAILEAIKVGDAGVLGGILGRILKLVIVTTQNRKVNITTCQKRKVRPITTQKRKVRVITDGG